MAYLAKFGHDIFVSYARNDDDEHWVAKFIANLEAKLKRRLGDADNLDIYFDRKHLKSNEHLEELKRAARGSAVFLAIGSPSYAVRKWTRDELEAFVTGNDYAGRIFTAENLPLDAGQAYPEPLANQHRMNFWRAGGLYSTTEKTIRPEEPEFGSLVDDLAQQIKDKLRAMRGGAAPAVTAQAPAGAGRYRTVLLAQPAGDLKKRLAELRIYLKESGVPLTREGVFPQGAKEFPAAFAGDLERASVVVHLLGDEPADPPDEDSPSYTQIQESLARAAGVKILRWRSPELGDLAGVGDPAQLELLKAAVAGSFEEFKAEVVRAAETPKTPPGRPEEAEPASKKPIVFVDAHMNDRAIARMACTAFDPERFLSLRPVWEGETEEFDESQKEGVEICDALLVIYGKVTPGYVHRRCSEYVMMRHRAKSARPARIVAVIYIPPDRKEPVGVYSGELEHYVITEDGEVPEGMRPDERSRIYAYRDLQAAISRVIEKLHA